jgi:hydroxymethylglutaryl-CoA reductase
VSATVSGRNLFVRFTCETSDAMGMNMVGKGVNKYAFFFSKKMMGVAI